MSTPDSDQTKIRAVTTGEGSRMAQRIGTYPLPGAARRTRSGTLRPRPLIDRLASLWGCSTRQAHQLTYGNGRLPSVSTMCADLVRELRSEGAFERAAAMAAAVEDAAAAPPVNGGEPTALREARADAMEDVSQALYCYRSAHEPATARDAARALLRARAAERAASLDDDREIAARHGLTL